MRLLDSKFGTSPGNGWVNGNNFAFKGGDVTGLNVNNLKFKANGGIFNFRNANDASFTNNDFQWGYEGNYYNRHVFYVSGSADGFIVEKNYFHDSENSDRNLEVWGWSNGAYSVQHVLQDQRRRPHHEPRPQFPDEGKRGPADSSHGDRDPAGSLFAGGVVEEPA